jgi:hypothetical protein
VRGDRLVSVKEAHHDVFFFAGTPDAYQHWLQHT